MGFMLTSKTVLLLVDQEGWQPSSNNHPQSQDFCKKKLQYRKPFHISSILRNILKIVATHFRQHWSYKIVAHERLLATKDETAYSFCPLPSALLSD
jgi:hypothetical protein